MKNMPARATYQDFVDSVNASGFVGEFEHVYIPLKANGVQNKGFAFASFRNVKDARSFQTRMSGACLRSASDKRIDIELARECRSLEAILTAGRSAHTSFQSRWGPVIVGPSQGAAM
jgi:hypothetical protein